MFVTASFFISASLIIVMLGFKYWEMSRGWRIAESWRTHFDGRVLYARHYLSHDVPYHIKKLLRHISLGVSHRVTELLLVLVRKVERRLMAFVNMVKGRRRIEKNDRPSSEFLNGVVEYKKNGNGRNEHPDLPK